MVIGHIVMSGNVLVALRGTALECNGVNNTQILSVAFVWCLDTLDIY